MSDIVTLNVRIPRESYDGIKTKAREAQMSINQFLNRAGSITTVEAAVMFPLQNNSGSVQIKE